MALKRVKKQVKRGAIKSSKPRVHVMFTGGTISMKIDPLTAAAGLAYLRELIDWESYFGWRRGEGFDLDAERAALTEVIETAATPQQAWNGAEWTATIPLAPQRLNSPSVMPVVLAKTAGRADGRRVSGAVKDALGRL